MGDTWRNVRQVSKTINRTKRIRNRGKKYIFLVGVIGGEKEGEKEKNLRIPSQILKDPSVGIRRTKS